MFEANGSPLELISLNAVEARIKRQKIREFSGDSYLEKESIVSRISTLGAYSDQQYLFGIYDSEDTWTVLSVTSLYASYKQKQVTLNLVNEAYKNHDYFGQDGNKLKSTVELTGGARIWMHSVEVSCGIQNIILLLQKLPPRPRLK